MQVAQTDHDEEVRLLAYGIWQEAGCPNGSELQHWLKAQEIWRQTHPAKKPRAKPSAVKKPTKIRMAKKAF